MASAANKEQSATDSSASDSIPTHYFQVEPAASVTDYVVDPDSANFLTQVETLSRRMSRRSTRSVYDGNLEVNPDDFELLKLYKTFLYHAEQEGLILRELGVSFENLSVYGKDQTYTYLSTMSDVLKGPYGAIRSAKEAKKIADRAILDSFDGLVKSGEMLLVLGRPGSGCSTFLRTISGTDTEMYTGLEGEIVYDGIERQEMWKHFSSDLIYNPELDVHFPHLTVKQTLDFALACKTPNKRVNGKSVQEHIDYNRDLLATVFGLRHTYSTKVGNDYVRGVSGGERKRVSIAEALACEGKIYCWDNATRGLDASTALEYARAIRVSTNLLKKTALVTIYQAGENIYETFDKVTVLYSGKQVYFGPIDEAKAYFEKMGYECPPRQTTAEFLTAVTDPAGRFTVKGMEGQVPKTAEEFRDYWKNSPEYSRLQQEIKDYKQQFTTEETKVALLDSIKQEKRKYQRVGSKYTVNIFQQLKYNLKRSFQIIVGDSAFTVIQVAAAISQALIIGSLYYNTPETVSGAFSRGGVIFFSVLYMSLTGMAEISNAFGARPILMKQRNYKLYHPAAYALADSISFIPVSVLTNIAFCLILYFLANLKREAGKFFTFVLFSNLVSLAMNYLFKATAAWNKSIAGANAIGGVFILAALMYSSYMIQRPSMHPWFKWISYINPVLYAFEAMLATEFHGRRMPCDSARLTPSGPGYSETSNNVCAFVGSVKDQTWVDGDRYIKLSFEYSFSHVWRNFGILIGFIIFFISMGALGFEVVRPMNGGIDRLFFLRGKKSDLIVMPGESAAEDEESGPSSKVELEKSSSNPSEILDDLSSKDIFAWKDVNYVIPYEGGERKLLDSVSGFCLPGALTALMGESGAGKTTLLNTLAQRIDMGVVTGDMLVNGKPLDSSFVRRTGYVQQQDIHMAESTVRESLQFAARMRRPQSVPDAEKLEYVEQIIKVLDMEEYADAIIGSPGSGLNVEQRKKLTIGVELVAKPSLLLFLDEPTSGLDSQSAWSIVQLLRSLANAGQAILCTIHQPSSTLFEEFDRLLLLRKGGQTVYFGDIGEHSHDIVSYFESHGARKCTSAENPAEYILEVIGAGATASTSQNWFDVWQSSNERVSAEKRIDELIAEGNARAPMSKEDPANSTELKSKYAASVISEMRHVTWRTALAFWRNPEYIMAKNMLMLINGLFIGFTFYDLKHTTTGMQNGMFCGFLSMVVSAPLINQIQAQCLDVRETYEGREKMSNTYRWWVMVLAQFVNEVPYTVFAATLLYVPLFFATKADTDASHAGVFFLSYAIFLEFFNISFGLMLAYFAPDVQSAAVLVSFFYSFIVSFSGVVQPVSLMPGFWTFMYKVSPYTYIIQNLVLSIIHGRVVSCSEKEFSVFDPPSGQTCGEYMRDFLTTAPGYLRDDNATSNCGYCAFSNADQYLATVGIKYSYVWRNIGFFCAYTVFNLCACLLLYKFVRLTKYNFSFSFLKSKKKN
ncbi:ATP-binding cassette, subfamily G (WHITE), member 2, SNQ2 [Metschnikowia aff. pulcherrima]|uniref:ATP-binding cassette, subfamily G (WHITE), member 2, SNQ2 n=1 Tax=Metschnikowia aff. pulcherrima TaxID=2163413 RepID=A0A4P6XNQ4_9ASCO|nr:ATP-binding cassette, subfamily G (WHITE), member 2, SNQ2 [Metschnikowia aff. pulcherrima]